MAVGSRGTSSASIRTGIGLIARAARSAGTMPSSASSRGVDAARQLGQGLDRLSRPPRTAPRAPWRRARASSSGDGLGQPEVHGERHQVLLRAVMDVALEPAPLGVLGLDEPFAGQAQLVGACCQLVVPGGQLGS